MSTPSNTVPGSPLESQVTAPAVITASRRMYWSVRRELWEYRSIYIAPLAAAAVFLLAFLTGLTLSPAHRHAPLDTPYELAAGLIMGTAFIVGIFYSLDALYGERRDRSILFWKSLPVSDLTTVLSKFAIPLIILPLLSFAIAVVTQFVMLLLSSAVLLGSGLSVGTLWGTDVVLPHVTDVPLPHSDRSWPLVRAHLRLVAAGFSLGTTRAVYMGVLASVRDLGSREDCVQNFAFPRHAAVPLDRTGAFHHHSAERKPDGNDVSAHSGAIFQYAGSVGRAGSRRDISRHSGAATAVPRTNLIRIRVWIQCLA